MKEKIRLREIGKQWYEGFREIELTPSELISQLREQGYILLEKAEPYIKFTCQKCNEEIKPPTQFCECKESQIVSQKDFPTYKRKDGVIVSASNICQKCGKLAQPQNQECNHEWICDGGTGSNYGSTFYYHCSKCKIDKKEETQPQKEGIEELKPSYIAYDRSHAVDKLLEQLFNKVNELISAVNGLYKQAKE